SAVADLHAHEPGHGIGETGDTKSTDLARAMDFELSTSQATPQPLRSAARAAVAPAIDFDQQMSPAAIRVHGDRVQLALTRGQSLALLLLIVALLVGASGVAVSAWVSLHQGGCRVGTMTSNCPADIPAPRAPGRSDIPA